MFFAHAEKAVEIGGNPQWEKLKTLSRPVLLTCIYWIWTACSSLLDSTHTVLWFSKFSSVFNYFFNLPELFYCCCCWTALKLSKGHTFPRKAKTTLFVHVTTPQDFVSHQSQQYTNMAAEDSIRQHSWDFSHLTNYLHLFWVRVHSHIYRFLCSSLFRVVLHVCSTLPSFCLCLCLTVIFYFYIHST